jgi:hypothetical protein
MNQVLLLGALLAIIGASLALLLVREHEIDREAASEEPGAGEGELALEGAQT